MIELKQGDCLEIMKDIPDKTIDMILCDLPYGKTKCGWDKILPFKPLWKQYKRIIKDDGIIVLFSKQPFTTDLISTNRRFFRYEIIWKKQQATNPMCAKKRVMPIHENILVFYKKSGTYNPQMTFGKKNYKAYKNDERQIGEVYGLKSIHRECQDGSRYPVSVLEFNIERSKLHPTQKPLKLCEWLVRTYTNEGDLVLDSCMGSGTTGEACLNTNRNFIGIELNEKYFNLAEERLKKERICEG